MAENTAISWTDATFNPWIGCTKVSPGCDNCYAAKSTPARTMGITWGAGQPRQRTKTWGEPVKWNKAHAAFFAQHARRRRVFCASLADVFDNEVPETFRTDLFALIEQTPNLDWLLLTKRIGNAAGMLPWGPCSPPWENVWLGSTIVNQEEADRDIPKLLATPARVRFLSMEPLLGPVDVSRYLRPLCDHGSVPAPDGVGGVMCGACEGFGCRSLDWVIVGGESGPGARPMHPDWARSLRDQCDAAGVPLHFKQWGEWMPYSQLATGNDAGGSDYAPYRKAESCVMQLDGQVAYEFPIGAMTMLRLGKKAAGRLLDGATHDAFPEVRHG